MLKLFRILGLEDFDWPRLFRGLLYVALCIAVYVGLIFSSDVLSFFVAKFFPLAKAIFYLGLLYSAVFVWMYATDQLPKQDSHNGWGDTVSRCFVMLVLMCSFSYLFLSPKRAEETWKVSGVERGDDFSLTEDNEYYCFRDALKQAERLKESRSKWARDSDGNFIEFDVLFEKSGHWPGLDGINKLFGTRLGIENSRFTLSDLDYSDGETADSPYYREPEFD